MRVDASQVLAQGGVKTKQGTDAGAEIIKSGVGAGIGAGESADEDLSLSKPNLMRGFSDLSLGPYAAKFSELGMPVTEDSARAMRDLMAQHPKLSMDEAAFLASNKITGDEGLMKSALEVISGGEKTSEMITKILSTLNIKSGEQEFLVNNAEPGTRDAKNIISGSDLPNNFSVNSSARAPLSELIAAVVKSASGLLDAQNQPETVTVKITSPIIPQTDINMQSNEQKIIENIQVSSQNGQTEQPGVLSAVQDGSAQTVANTVLGETIAADAAVRAAAGTGDKNPAENTAAGTQNLEQTVTNAEQNLQTGEKSQANSLHSGNTGAENVRAENTAVTGNPGNNTNRVAGALAQMLSEMPEFKGTPQAALTRFSNMLLRIAGDTHSSGEAGAVKDTEMLAAQLDKLFTKIDRNDPDAGMRLRQAREELFARLTLVQEEISRASQPAREQLLGQTQKLMDHVRLLNNIDQFVYMQLPVKVREEQKTADLYVFKRKGGKRIDQDNVNILLSIDLEFMGHWEGLLNIKGKDVYINMEVQGEKEREHFMSNTVLLHELLAEDGFKLVNTNIKISQEETTPLTALNAFDRYSGKRQGGIDFFL